MGEKEICVCRLGVSDVNFYLVTQLSRRTVICVIVDNSVVSFCLIFQFSGDEHKLVVDVNCVKVELLFYFAFAILFEF